MVDEGIDKTNKIIDDTNQKIDRGIEMGKKGVENTKNAYRKAEKTVEKGVQNTKDAYRKGEKAVNEGIDTVKGAYKDTKEFVLENKARIERNAKKAAEFYKEQKAKADKLLSSASDTLDGLFDRKLALLKSVDFNFKSERTGEYMAVEKDEKTQVAMRSNIKKKPEREKKKQNLMVKAYQIFYGLKNQSGELDQETVDLLVYQGDCGNKDAFDIKEELAKASKQKTDVYYKPRFNRDVSHDIRQIHRQKRAAFGRGKAAKWSDPEHGLKDGNGITQLKWIIPFEMLEKLKVSNISEISGEESIRAMKDEIMKAFCFWSMGAAVNFEEISCEHLSETECKAIENDAQLKIQFGFQEVVTHGNHHRAESEINLDADFADMVIAHAFPPPKSPKHYERNNIYRHF